MTQPPTAPPGWYPTLTRGVDRWWDGTQWTESLQTQDYATYGFWRGSEIGSLVGAIVLFITSIPVFGVALLFLLSGSWVFLGVGLLGLVLIGGGVLMLFNYWGVRRGAAASLAEEAAAFRARESG
jgi:hypothetical protein